MGLVQRFMIVWMLSVQLVLTSPITGSRLYYQMGGKLCKLCPAGEYKKTCSECAPCPDGSYTTELNREEYCRPCDPDCSTENHLMVAQKCTNTSDLKCVCEKGFRCTQLDTFSGNCRSCDKSQDVATTEAAAVPPNEDKHTHSSVSRAHSSTSSKPCQFPKCDPQSVSPAGNDTSLERDHTSSQLVAVLCAVVGCFLVIVILFSIYHFGDETCFKQAITKLYNEGGNDAPYKPKEPTHRFTRDPSDAKQQQSSGASDAKLGPVHVHNPGTVIIGLLNQFTGHVSPKFDCKKTAEGVISREDDERDCPVFHPTSSPGIHLSEEERNREIGNVFFPSQEQGKDSHMSKEEML